MIGFNSTTEQPGFDNEHAEDLQEQDSLGQLNPAIEVPKQKL